MGVESEEVVHKIMLECIRSYSPWVSIYQYSPINTYFSVMMNTDQPSHDDLALDSAFPYREATSLFY